MKPRTQLEKDLQAVIDGYKINPLTPKQMQQAHDLWQQKENKKYKAMLFTTTQRIGGMQLTKCYKAQRIGRADMFTTYRLCIVKAERDGQTAWAARPTGMGYIIDNFSRNGELTIKSEHDWYDHYANAGFPLRSVGKADEYAVVRNVNHNTYEFRDNRVETLAKIGREDIVYMLIANEKSLSDKMYAAIKVATKHHYQCEENELWRWMEYVDMLIKNGKDYRSPHYICPDNLLKSYYKMIDINDKRMEKQRAERDKMKNEAYRKRLNKWLDMVISDSGITIKPLQSITEFEEEGRVMHHCVFANAYYEKKDTLILSAKDSKGKRLATIEYNLKRNEIVQCRASCNNVPKDHDLICALIKEAIANRVISTKKRTTLKAA